MWPNTCSSDQFFSVDLDSFSKYLFIEHWLYVRPCSGQRGCTVNSSYKPLSGGLYAPGNWLQVSRKRRHGSSSPPHCFFTWRGVFLTHKPSRPLRSGVMPMLLSNATFLNQNQSLLGNSRYSRAFPKENKLVFQKFKGLNSVIRIHLCQTESLFSLLKWTIYFSPVYLVSIWLFL